MISTGLLGRNVEAHCTSQVLSHAAAVLQRHGQLQLRLCMALSSSSLEQLHSLPLILRDALPLVPLGVLSGERGLSPGETLSRTGLVQLQGSPLVLRHAAAVLEHQSQLELRVSIALR